MPTAQRLNTNPSLRLLNPIARCQIGDDIFLMGDGRLIDAEVSLGEGEKSSTCRFTIYDPDQKFAQKYFYASYEAGGLVGLGPDEATNGGATTGVGNFAGGDTAATAQAIVQECLRQGVSDHAQIAYILATAQHESGMGQFMEEFASGSAYEGRCRDLGNCQPGDGVRFKGRGYVQITGRRNYTRYSELTGVDIVGNPSKAADPNVALFTLVHGMKNGIFTSQRLDRYVGGNRRDFFNARRVVNGTDRASLIAGYADTWLPQVPGLVASAGGTAPAQPTATETAPPKKDETTEKGGQITVSLGYSEDQLSHFAFLHTGTKHKGFAQMVTTFEGKAVRWVLTRQLKNSTYQGVTLKQLAARFARSYGLELQMSVDGPRYEHLDQTGISDYELLRRECDRVGFRITEQNATLIIEPRTTLEDEGYVLEYGVNLDSFEFSDSAQDDSGSSAPQSEPKSDTSTGQITFELDPALGEFQQEETEPATTDGSVATTGSPIIENKPNTDGATDAQDKVRRSQALRRKGFPGRATITATPASLLVTPDTPLLTSGFEADFLNRVWVIDTVSHKYGQQGLKTELSFYSPMRPRVTEGATGGTTTAAGNCNQKLLQATLAYQGASTRAGPGNGNVACVWAINRIMESASIPNPWNNSDAVVSAQAALKASHQQIEASQAQPGDIVIWLSPSAGHIGVVLESGGTKVISNSSSRAAFAWVASNGEMESYYGARAEFYRLTSC